MNKEIKGKKRRRKEVEMPGEIQMGGTVKKKRQNSKTAKRKPIFCSCHFSLKNILL